MSLSIRDIRYVLAVVTSGQLSAAAAELGVTQPALTKAVKRVEEEFGIDLFERAARGMVLTSTGLRVVDQLHALQSAYTDTVHLVDELRASSSGLLRIGVTDITARNRIASALGSLLGQRPGLRVKLSIDRSDGLVSQIGHGELDLALVPVYEGQLIEADQTRIENDLMVPVVRKGHPLATRSALTPGDLEHCGWILSSALSSAYRTLSAVLLEAGLGPPNIVMEAPFASEINLAVLAETDLVTLAPRSFLEHSGKAGFVELPIPALQIPRSVVLLSRPGAFWSPLMEAMKERLLKA